MATLQVEIEESLFIELQQILSLKLHKEQFSQFVAEHKCSSLFSNNSAICNELAALCDHYGSDKGTANPALQNRPYSWQPHTYTDFYSMMFGHCRNYMQRIFECGIGTNNPNLKSNMTESGKPGASLRAWRDYFPNAEIIAGDIDQAILFSEERIKCFWLDQTNPGSISNFWQMAGAGDFDVMLDDGLHVFEAGVCLFENSIHRLKPNGIYIIEDVTIGDLSKYRQYFNSKSYQVGYVVAHRNGELLTNSDSWSQLDDNNLIWIKKR